MIAKRFKRTRKVLKIDEVSELPYKVLEEKLKKVGLDKCVIRIKRKNKGYK